MQYLCLSAIKGHNVNNSVVEAFSIEINMIRGGMVIVCPVAHYMYILLET